MKIKKNVLIPLIISVFCFLFNSFLVYRIPYGIAPHELSLLKLIHLPPSIGFLYFRLISPLVVALISLLLYFFIQYLTKKQSEAFFTSLAFSISPWVFMLSRSLNIYVFFLFATICVLFCISKKKNVAFFYFFVVIFSFLKNGLLQTPTHFQDFFNQLLQIFDLQTLFFAGDTLSVTMKIPFTGFFMMVDCIPFIFGIHYLFTDSQWKKHKKLFFHFFLVGIVFNFINAGSLMIFRQVLILSLYTIVIGLGYRHIVVIIQKRKHLIANVVLIGIFLSNLFLYQEFFYRHFDKLNSTEWGYAEVNLIKYLTNHPEITHISITTKKEGLKDYITYFLGKKELKSIVESQIPSECGSGYNRRCIVKEDELYLLKPNVGNKKIIFYNAGGLPEFYLL